MVFASDGGSDDDDDPFGGINMEQLARDVDTFRHTTKPAPGPDQEGGPSDDGDIDMEGDAPVRDNAVPSPGPVRNSSAVESTPENANPASGKADLEIKRMYFASDSEVVMLRVGRGTTKGRLQQPPATHNFVKNTYMDTQGREWFSPHQFSIFKVKEESEEDPVPSGSKTIAHIDLSKVASESSDDMDIDTEGGGASLTGAGILPVPATDPGLPGPRPLQTPMRPLPTAGPSTPAKAPSVARSSVGSAARRHQASPFARLAKSAGTPIPRRPRQDKEPQT